MNMLQVISRKRDKLVLSDSEINYFISELTKGTIPDYQASALLMAIYLRGMTDHELATLTSAMLHSGEVIDLSFLGKISVDKHSTGGVGDKASIPLAPAVAACGIAVPMISGRGLGHTGGTLDKLESIPGFRTDLTISAFKAQLEKIGCSLIGQTKDIAPADKKLYALRDVTATVECLPLIASSIMSKKIAEGIDALVLDVKFGSGAFMSRYEDAHQLARTMVDIGTRMGKKTVALLTNMDEPLGKMIGNSLEIMESIDILKGKPAGNLSALVLELGAEMLVLGQKAHSLAEGREKITEVLNNGKALEKFVQIIEAQGGNPKIIEDYSLLPHSTKKLPILATEAGFLSRIDCKSVGLASVFLGGGRQTLEDIIDPKVGIEMCVVVGDKVEIGQPLCVLHVGDRENQAAIAQLKNSFTMAATKPIKSEFFRDRIVSQL